MDAKMKLANFDFDGTIYKKVNVLVQCIILDSVVFQHVIYFIIGLIKGAL